MEAEDKRKSDYLKRWQLYRSEKDKYVKAKPASNLRRKTICIGEGKSSNQEEKMECQSGMKNNAKAGSSALTKKHLRFSTNSCRPEKRSSLMPAAKRYVASRTDSNLTKLKEEARKRHKNVKPAMEACEYKLNDLLATSQIFGTPNTVRVPALLKKVTKRCLTEQNGRAPVQEPLKSTTAKENLEQAPPTTTGKRKHLYRSKETISSLRKKSARSSISVVPTLNKTSTSKRLNFDKNKTTGQVKLTPTSVKAQKEKKETARKEIQDQLKSVIEECSILLDSDCPPACILPWLEEIQQKIPLCLHSAEFWMLKARVQFLLKDVDQLFEVFGNAMKYKAKPADVIAESLPKMIKDLVSSKENSEATPMMTTPPSSRGGAGFVPYTPSQTPYDMPSVHGLDISHYAGTPMQDTTPGLHMRRSFHSGNVKYLVRRSTPFKYRSESVEDSDAILITPVRRTTRRSVVSARSSRLDVIIDSLDDCILGDKKNVLFQDNPAIPQ
ncbi:uncharacterized protein LOC115229908 [Octopus sinensis]|uniref:Uncharacterized protein LOC115229908 n=1 Tax=Octopus sinensis TaxID=2607531 RepID=A0A6P7TUQ0_9MOLL|nr:uncharacterized protein LOC115229908 [Octopus sinensis]